MALVRKYFIKGLIVSLLLGWVFTFLGVYDTNYQPMFKRYIFWTSTMLVGFLATGLSGPFVWYRLFPGKHRYIHLALIAAIISLPVTLVLAAYDHNYGIDWSLYIWSRQYLYVIFISLILIFGGYFILKAQGLMGGPTEPDHDSSETVNAAEIDSVAATKSEFRFLQRLSPKLHSAELYAVASDDHYLRVYTSAGEELILMRLSDALRELESVAGLQTHRSWWVANSAVAERQKQQGKMKLLLKSGLTVPVSRSFEKQVKDARFH